MYGRVRATRQISRSMVRVELDGEGLAGFDPTGWTDAYVNAYFPPADFAYAIPFDVEEVKALPAEQRPPSRRYTVRNWDSASGVLTLDFVVHGDSVDGRSGSSLPAGELASRPDTARSSHSLGGVAGPWALRAQPGDLLQFNAPSGGYRPDPTADWHLMIGDESALPAIGASLAAAPIDARVYAFIEVDGRADQLELPTTAGLYVRWLHREANPGKGDLLIGALRSFARPPGRAQAFVHGEALANRELRRYLLTDWALPRADVSISPYWRRGDADESWRKVRKAWLAEVEQDV